MEGFNEQVVKRANKPKNMIIKILSVLVLIMIPIVFSMLAFVITADMFYIG